MLRIGKSSLVVDFRDSPKPRNYLSRREQWRLLLLVMSLGLVLVLMGQARDPSNWAWFFASGDATDRSSAMLAPGDGLPADDPTPQQPPAEQSGGSPVSVASDYFPGVNPTYLDAVRDDSVFRDAEQDAWFHLFEILSKTDEARLRRASTGAVTYGQLFRQSKHYRGRLVTVRGTIRGTALQQAPENDRQIDHYYLTALQPADNPSEIMIVYCLDLPEGFPTGDNVSADVEVTGFYFKRWPPPFQEDLRTRPVLLARTVHWEKPPPVRQKWASGVVGVVTLIGVALCASLFLATWVFLRTRRGLAPQPAASPQFEALRDVQLTPGPRLPWETTDRQQTEA